MHASPHLPFQNLWLQAEGTATIVTLQLDVFRSWSRKLPVGWCLDCGILHLDSKATSRTLPFCTLTWTFLLFNEPCLSSSSSTQVCSDIGNLKESWSTWNLVTHCELQKLKTFPSGKVAWYWGNAFLLQKWHDGSESTNTNKIIHEQTFITDVSSSDLKSLTRVCSWYKS